jgi:hypothetical protein
MKEKQIHEDIKEIVIIRLETLPADKKISIGSYGEFSKEELIEHVKKDDKIGKKIIEVEMEFLKALKKGLIYE